MEGLAELIRIWRRRLGQNIY